MKKEAVILVFVLFLPFVWAAPDGYEPDGSVGAANWILTDNTPQTHTFDPADDNDFLKFNATRGFYYLIQTVNLSSADNTNAQVYLFDTDGSSPLSADQAGLVGYDWSAHIVWRAINNGTYYLQINESNGTAGGTYNISVEQQGFLTPYLVYPSSWMNATIYGEFNFTAGVTCIGGPCGQVTAVLDPETGAATAGEGVLSEIESEGSARVIVKLRDKPVEALTMDDILSFKHSRKAREEFLQQYGLLSRALDAENRQRLKQQIRENQDGVLGTLDLGTQKKGVSASASGADFIIKHLYSTTNAFSGTVTEQGLEKLLQNPDVEEVYLDRPVRASLDVSVPLINADDVWNLEIDGQSVNGSGQTVCVLDTGINYSHPDFGGFAGFPNAKVIGGYDYVNLDNDPLDDHGHGSHCAGIVASEDSTYRGVAPGARIVAVKVLDSGGYGWSSDIIAGIDWCTDNSSVYNISVISMSLGSSWYDNNGFGCADFDPATTQAIDGAVSNSILVAVAAGNYWGSPYYLQGVSEPACNANATSVGISDDSDSIVSWGQRGFTLDLMAPGSGILATNYVGTHTSKSGTSMSTPHVAGTAALIRQYFLQKYNRTLSPKDIERLMKYSGKDIPDSATNFTYSRIDAYSAVTSKGAVSTTVGATPFYTTTANPHDSSCLSDMQAGESCNVSWMVNATGDFQNYTFFAIFETVYMSNITPKLNITITNNIPQLTSPSLNNITGNTTTVFNFTVNYSDADNHEPYFIYIVIGNSSQSMLPADVSDTNYSDGAVYYYQTTLVEGNYSYYFNASDRFNTTTTGVVYAPNVTDNTAPSLVVSSPQDNLNTSTALQSFVFNVSDESAQYLNCSLVFDNTAVISVNVSSGFSGSMNYTVSSEGMHYWNISCSDGTNVNISLTRRIAYDATAPDVTLVSPPEVAALSGNYANFTFNASDNVFSTVSCSLVVGSSVYYSNVSVANATDTTVFLSNLSAGSNSWRVNCTDSAANTANSPSRTVIVPLANYTATVNATANSTLNVSATASVAINLTLLQNATGELEVLEYGTNPTNTSASSANGFAVLGLGTFVSVNASANISGNLSWWILNIYYSEGSLPSNIEESTIRIYYFNSTLGQWVLQNSTVDTANNRVWANLTHFSIYSAGGAEHVSTGGGGGGGGGGGATASKDPIVIEPTLSAQLVEAPKNQEIGVVYEGKSYLFKVKSFTGSIVTLNSLPDIATYNIANGLSMGFDLDQDGKFDIQISYSGAYSSKAMLVFYAVPKPQPITLLPPKPREIKQVPEENVSLEETVSAQELETPAPEPKVSVQLLSESPAIQTVSLSFIEENKLYLYIGGVVLVFVVVFIVMNAIFGRRGPTRTAKKEVKKAVKEVKR